MTSPDSVHFRLAGRGHMTWAEKQILAAHCLAPHCCSLPAARDSGIKGREKIHAGEKNEVDRSMTWLRRPSAGEPWQKPCKIMILLSALSAEHTLKAGHQASTTWLPRPEQGRMEKCSAVAQGHKTVLRVADFDTSCDTCPDKTGDCVSAHCKASQLLAGSRQNRHNGLP